MELKTFVEQVFDRIQKWVDPQITKLQDSLDRLDRDLKGSEVELAARIEEVKTTVPDSETIVESILKRLPEPEKGDKGDPGEKGEAGEKGDPGQDGQDGKPGADGESVSLVELRELVQAEVQAAFAAIPRPENGKDGVDGKDGRDGVDGKDGRDGVDGEKGDNGRDGSDGKDGRDGVDGKDGRDGADGIPGRDGVDGKDALAIEVLPEINFERSYPRGTFATHNGGLWRAYQKTDKTFGWECVVSGYPDVKVEQRGIREAVLTVKSTLGAEQEFVFNIPAMVYKQVYREEETYDAGDTVTWGGSLWHCNQDGTKGMKPGNVESKDHWTLCAKKGRDK